VLSYGSGGPFHDVVVTRSDSGFDSRSGGQIMYLVPSCGPEPGFNQALDHRSGVSCSIPHCMPTSGFGLASSLISSLSNSGSGAGSGQTGKYGSGSGSGFGFNQGSGNRSGGHGPSQGLSDHTLVSGSNETSRRPRKLWIKLERFDGSGCLESFLAQFNNCASYNCWRDDERLAHLRSCLTGAGAQVLWDAGCDSIGSIDKLLKLMKNRYGSDGQAEKFRSELRLRRRKPGESLQSVFQDIRRLTALAFKGTSNETTEIVARDAIFGCIG
jgi:hypothetical protein